ncbi:hypothetical protein JYB64_05345 [Algoriphagus aestuarii]|nr:hypothetical protein [Algoriphagus aestuarii]
MKLSNILLPHYLQKIGWIMFIPASVLGLLTLFLEFEFPWLEYSGVRESGFLISSDENLTNELAIFSLFLSLFLISFSKEKEEDELIQKIRLDSILFGCYGYFLLNIIAAFLFYDTDYLSFMFFNMFSLPILFIIRFRWVMFQQRKSLGLVL